MLIESLKFRGCGSFISEWAGFNGIRPINLIIGRNNTGKSQLLDLVRVMCAGLRTDVPFQFLCSGKLEESDLRQVFQENVTDHGHDLYGNHWRDHGSYFIDAEITWELMKSPEPTSEKLGNDRLNKRFTKSHLNLIKRVLFGAKTGLEGRNFSRLYADRDIQAELPSQSLGLDPSGQGATNIIKRHLVSSNASLPRERIQNELREALNYIFGEDGNFSELQVQEHESSGKWEIYLGEEKKGLIALSSSGSGLKTVILVLLNLLVLPKIKGASPSQFVFAFEELENNLHPALLRRLLRYIEKFVIENDSTVFLTTHSNIALDLFGTSDNAQIIHVTHDGSTARTSTVDAHFQMLNVVSELGAKPSDILQANGIIWVEGPSDAIYLNKWIEIASDGKLKQGRDYLCAFYGGALLARIQFSDPEKAEDELINLLLANPQIIVLCDSDKKSAGQKLKSRVRRIRDEVEKVPTGLTWVTYPKEIENYLSGSILEKALGMKKSARSPEIYEDFFPGQKRNGESYAEKVLGKIYLDKIDLALRCREHITKSEMDQRFDWKQRMEAVIGMIARWNK